MRKPARNQRGLFITFEGGEGAGKTTQINLLNDRLKQAGHEVISTREPGGTAGAEIIRELLLGGAIEEFGAEYEALMFFAARMDHVDNLIAPALAENKVVICDRFIDSTRVYQGLDSGLSPDLLDKLEGLVCDKAWPNVSFILDIEPVRGMERAAGRREPGSAPDRFEKDAIDLQSRRREAFLAIAEEDPDRCRIINADAEVDQVHEAIWKHVNLMATKVRRRKVRPR